MRPGGCGTRPMIDSAVTLLPQPDSPTMPRVRPGSSLKSTPSTARTSPPSPANTVRNPRTSSRLFVAGNFFLDAGALERAPRARLAWPAAYEGDEALVRLVVEPPQLGERIGVVVHPDVDVGVVFGRVDEQRRGLLAPLVAAGGLARLQRGNKSFGKAGL